jgi:tRNA-specific 2-thiouridylase
MRVVVAMSGGVDSSVSALLLKEAGHDVVGVFLRNGVAAPGARGRSHGCCGASDALDAEEVAGLLGIPFYALDEAAAFERIVADFVGAYERGETPNPCVQCNRELKFGELLRFANALGAARVASGHYARCEADGGEVVLRRARERAKDQSYVLATVAADALARSLFPVGELRKEEVRDRARRAGLPVHAKAESQEICFVPRGETAAYLAQRLPMAAGAVVDASGRRLGAHRGAGLYTVGQRAGFGSLVEPGPWYVLRVDAGANQVVVGRRHELAVKRIELDEVSFIDGVAPRSVRCEVRLRYHAPAIPATYAAGTVELDEPFLGAAPGQAAVLYTGTRVLGGGTIARPTNS